MTRRKLKIAVIGAGASGIMTVVKLREIGQNDVRVFERASDIGGTWRDQRYPGVACDVPSHLYRFSFAPNPDWSQVCASGTEIHAYLRGVYEKYKIAANVTFNAEVQEARWDGEAWRLETAAGRFGPFDVVITAMGILRTPLFPQIEGREGFAGKSMHSAQWDTTLDLAGKRVGVIGTGSTATQIIPAIVDRVKEVVQFQRTPQWIMPLPNDPIPEDQKRIFRTDPDAMRRHYEKLADDFNNKFAAAVVGANPRVYERMVQLCEENLENSVADPALREKLRPDYKVGCKRLVMSDGYYAAIQKPNARLVTEKISRIEPQGVRTADGELHEVDVLVYATGISAHTPFAPMKLVGSNGLSIDEAWKDGAKAYLAIGIPEFPNFFTIGGPNSPIGNFSFLMTAESQCSLIVQLVDTLASGAATALAPSRRATEAFNQAVRDKIGDTVWSTGCSNWYQDKHGNISSWPWTYGEFEAAMSRPKLEDFDMHERVDA